MGHISCFSFFFHDVWTLLAFHFIFNYVISSAKSAKKKKTHDTMTTKLTRTRLNRNETKKNGKENEKSEKKDLQQPQLLWRAHGVTMVPWKWWRAKTWMQLNQKSRKNITFFSHCLLCGTFHFIFLFCRFASAMMSNERNKNEERMYDCY